MAVSQRTSEVRVDLSSASDVTAGAVWQYDHGLTLTAVGVTSAEVPQFQFTNGLAGDSVSVLTSDDASGYATSDIPDVLLTQAKEIIVYLYYEDTNSGYTVKTVTIPVRERVKPETIAMSLPQMGQVNQLATELEDLTERTESMLNLDVDVTSIAEDATGSGRLVSNPDGSKTLALRIPSGATGPMPVLTFSAETGADADVEATETEDGYALALTLPRGEQGIQGIQGVQGERGIQGVQGERGLQGETGPMPTLVFNTPITGAPLDEDPTSAVELQTTEITDGQGNVTGYTLTFTIPRGNTGQVGNIWSSTVSPASDINNPTGAVGTATRAARSDHQHPPQVNITGNAATASALANAVTIGAASFNGSQNITLQQMGAIGSINGTIRPGANANVTLTAAQLGGISSITSGETTLTPTNGVVALTAADIDMGDDSGRSVQDAVVAATPEDVLITLPASGWTDTTNYSYQSVSCEGMSTTTKFFVDVNLSQATAGTETDVLTAFGLIGRVVGNNGSIMAYCYDSTPETDIPLRIREVN